MARRILLNCIPLFGGCSTRRKETRNGANRSNWLRPSCRCNRKSCRSASGLGRNVKGRKQIRLPGIGAAAEAERVHLHPLHPPSY